MSKKKPGVAVVQAWRDLDKRQCGMCTSEQIMAATALLTENANPTDIEIEKGLGGHTCECLTAEEVYGAVQTAVNQLNNP